MEYQINEHESNVRYYMAFLAGLLLGGLGGALVMLLEAPQSGAKTRAKIKKKSKQLRDQTVENVEDAMKQVRSKTHQITADVRDYAEELQQRG